VTVSVASVVSNAPLLQATTRQWQTTTAV
jgi:hypothetical protein